MGIKRNCVHVLAAALFVFSVTGPGTAQAIAAATVSNTDALARIRIGNFGTVNDHLYRGSQPKGHDFTDLAALGAKAVIDLQKDGPSNEAGIVRRAGMEFFRIPMDTSDPPTNGQIAEFFKIVNDPTNQPVYVHCAGGRHRTGALIAIYRMTYEGWTADQAYREMRQYHFEGFFDHPALRNFVFAYKPAPASQPGVIATTIVPTK
jgi:protein tyrosine/serine phosphatase